MGMPWLTPLLFISPLLYFFLPRWQRSRTGVQPAPTVRPTSSGTMGPRTSTEWASRGGWVKQHTHKISGVLCLTTELGVFLVLPGLCSGEPRSQPVARAPLWQAAGRREGIYMRKAIWSLLSLCGRGWSQRSASGGGGGVLRSQRATNDRQCADWWRTLLLFYERWQSESWFM